MPRRLARRLLLLSWAFLAVLAAGIQPAFPHRSLTHALPAMRACNVDGDAIQPMLERALAAKSTQAAKRPDERFLRQVFGVPTAGRQPSSEVEHTHLIASYQGVDGIRVARLHRLDECPICVHSEIPTPLTHVP